MIPPDDSRLGKTSADLAQLDAGKPESERLHHSASVYIAVANVRDESPLVARSAAWALAHLKGDLAIATLINLNGHPDPAIREAVAVGLACSPGPEAISALTRLMDDDDDEVRNWATFAIGSAYSKEDSRLPRRLDSPPIREALRARLSDRFDEVRDEALWGLAIRRDPGALSLLLVRLESAAWIRGDRLAAAEALDLPCHTSIEELCVAIRSLLGDLRM